jgi:hypothetical protein
MIKALKKLRIEGMFLNIIKAIYDSHRGTIILNREQLKPFLCSQECDRAVRSLHAYSI